MGLIYFIKIQCTGKSLKFPLKRQFKIKDSVPNYETTVNVSKNNWQPLLVGHFNTPKVKKPLYQNKYQLIV